MISRLFSIGFAGTGITLICSSLCLVPIAAAQNVDTPECVQETYDALAHEKRLYRSVLFGQKSADALPNGSVEFDREGNAWIKKNTDQWRTLAQGFTNTIWTDTQVTQQTDVPTRRGIFEIRKSPTSDLIPMITQAFRAYQCRLRAVCAAAEKSQTADPTDTTIQVQPDGCIELDEPVLRDCKDNTQETVGANTCEKVITSMFNQEEQMLILLTAYDASYRTLMQFEGVFEGFLSDFRFPLINPLWQTVRALGGFAHMPCFLSQCDE